MGKDLRRLERAPDSPRGAAGPRHEGDVAIRGGSGLEIERTAVGERLPRSLDEVVVHGATREDCRNQNGGESVPVASLSVHSPIETACAIVTS